MDELIERLRARAEASGGDKLLEEAAAALEAAREDAERLEEALRGLKDLMLKQVKWEPCDSGVRNNARRTGLIRSHG